MHPQLWVKPNIAHTGKSLPSVEHNLASICPSFYNVTMHLPMLYMYLEYHKWKCSENACKSIWLSTKVAPCHGYKHVTLCNQMLFGQSDTCFVEMHIELDRIKCPARLMLCPVKHKPVHVQCVYASHSNYSTSKI